MSVRFASLFLSLILSASLSFAKSAKQPTETVAQSAQVEPPGSVPTTQPDSEPASREELSFSKGWGTHFKEIYHGMARKENLMLLGVGTAMTLAALPFDEDVNGEVNMPDDLTNFGSKWGGGQYTGMIVLTQLLLDFDNGFKHLEAWIYTAVSGDILRHTIRRRRPNNSERKTSFPSGHTATATVAATSLWYAYGWKVGVPAALLAGVAGAARLDDQVHFLSDVVFGAFLGIYWGRVVYDPDSQLMPYFDLSRGVVGFTYKY